MTPYVHPSPDGSNDQRPPAISPTTPISPSAYTIVSSDIIDSVPSSLSGMSILEDDSATTPGESLEPMDTSTPPSAKPGPFSLHKRFFFEDGNVTFLVEGILYRVHRYFFCRDSKEFMTRLSRLPAQEGPYSPVISLENVKSKDFDAFLSVLYPLDFNALVERSFEELSSILDLSSRWGFTSIRDLAIRCLKPPTPHQRLLLGRRYAIEQWILPALQELCEGSDPLTSDEARLMRFEDVILIGSVREAVRSRRLAVEAAGIRDCIEAWRSGKTWNAPARPAPVPHPF
ncbi:hypothetical protein F5148DRAFT_916261 [Russula earlei]|uniref:Uncharacterized protein n=1 Tax=Russula earlei TaxID=71964 RepID=A0ACC0U9U5_9AGAM|nr:hypothetical protein F5148DRAFT_916261 [Russula earlei]